MAFRTNPNTVTLLGGSSTKATIKVMGKAERKADVKKHQPAAVTQLGLESRYYTDGTACLEEIPICGNNIEKLASIVVVMQNDMRRMHQKLQRIMHLLQSGQQSQASQSNQQTKPKRSKQS